MALCSFLSLYFANDTKYRFIIFGAGGAPKIVTSLKIKKKIDNDHF